MAVGSVLRIGEQLDRSLRHRAIELGGGFMFPFDSMPAPARWLGELLPLTDYIRICRAVLLRGSPAWSLPQDLAALAAFFAVGLLIASRTFRKELG